MKKIFNTLMVILISFILFNCNNSSSTEDIVVKNDTTLTIYNITNSGDLLTLYIYPSNSSSTGDNLIKGNPLSFCENIVVPVDINSTTTYTIKAESIYNDTFILEQTVYPENPVFVDISDENSTQVLNPTPPDLDFKFDSFFFPRYAAQYELNGYNINNINELYTCSVNTSKDPSANITTQLLNMNSVSSNFSNTLKTVNTFDGNALYDSCSITDSIEIDYSIYTEPTNVSRTGFPYKATIDSAGGCMIGDFTAPNGNKMQIQWWVWGTGDNTACIYEILTIWDTESNLVTSRRSFRKINANGNTLHHTIEIDDNSMTPKLRFTTYE